MHAAGAQVAEGVVDGAVAFDRAEALETTAHDDGVEMAAFERAQGSLPGS